MQFNEKLKKLRSGKGVTQAELAEKVYVSRSAVAKWESGLGLPSGESLATLAEFFGVDKSELLSDPETESVIINKNSALSKQKLWIIALVALSCVLIVVAAILIPFAVKNSNTVKRELIFATERDIDTSEIIIYTDSQLNADNYFAPTRTFAIPAGMNVVELPQLLIKVTRKGQVSFEKISADPTFTYSDQIYIYKHTDGEFYGTLRDTSLDDCTGCLNIKVNGLCLSVKILRASSPVESIDISLLFGGNKIGLSLSTELKADITPSNAPHKSYSYVIEKITHSNGVIYSAPLSKYAYVDGNTLYTTEYIDVGAKIYLYAETDVEKVKSNTLAIEVERVEVMRIDFENSEWLFNSITSGEWLHVNLKFFPEYATINVKNEEFNVAVTPDIASVEKTANGFILCASDKRSDIGKRITVEVSTPEGYSRVWYYDIEGIRVQNVVVINADTGLELDDVTEISYGASLNLQAVITPADAYYTDIHFRFSTQPGIKQWEHVKVTTDGKMTFSCELPVSPETYLTVLSGAVISKEYKIIMKPITVERVELSAESQYITSYSRTRLSVSIFPENATLTSTTVRFECTVIGEPTNITIDSSGLLVIGNAVTGTIIRVTAIVDGAKSNTIEFIIID